MKTSNQPGISTNTRRLLRRAVGMALMASCIATQAYGASNDGGKPGGGNNPYPGKDDPSAFTNLVYDEDGSALEGLHEANEGAFEGGETGHPEDASANNVLQGEDQRDDGRFNVPTNGAPSPMYGAKAFSQQMLRFEEFGTDDLDLNASKPAGWTPMPAPANAGDAPDGGDLEDFLSQDIWPTPTKFANTDDENPWAAEIEDYLGRTLDTPPMEGRPPGLGWSHQRWDDFTPSKYFKSAQAGARTNGGFRDVKQDHGYTDGEFGPKGLYHNTAGVRATKGTTAGISIKFHPNMPVQDHTSLWTFDGTLPPKLLKSKYGETVLFRHHNALPVDVAANRGFGVHTITTHEHNGHNPAESDGYANSFFFPGQYYDYRWPMTLAGSDTINTDASDMKAGSPDGNGGITKVPGDWRETMSTHWFHDHMLDFTAQNVYKGNAAMMNYYSAIDRGNEDIDDGVNLRLPSGNSQDWGNRDYDVNLLLAEKAWDQDGQLWFNPFNLKGFIGDVMTVNWLYKPYMEVRARQYRFRLLNGSVSRYFKVALVDGGGNRVPFYLVANDGNIMEHSVYIEDGELPTQGIAERYDIIVDFSQFRQGDKLYMVNLLQHKDGQATDVPIDLESIINGDYAPETVDENDDGIADRWANGDPVVGKFLEFRVKKYNGKDNSMDPSEYVEGGKTMIPLRMPTEDELANALHRTFEFERQPTDEKPWVIETDGGKGFNMDPRRVSAAPSKNSGQLEVWKLVNSGTWSHPIHIHFEEGIILRRNGLPPEDHEKWARKDVYRLGPQPDSGDLVEVALRFREFAGTYMEHCHNTQHEDHAMLLRWDIEHPGQVKLMPTPLPTWDGVSYVDSVALPTIRTGDGVGADSGVELDPIDIWIKNGVTVSELDNIRDEFIGDALNPNDNNERGAITFELSKGVNIDNDGNATDVYFIMHDVSDEELAEELGVAWAGNIAHVPDAASSTASVSPSGKWTFYGDLPNDVWANPPCRVSDGSVGGEPCQNLDSISDNDESNDYSPLRKANYGGKDVVFNMIFMKWGPESYEQNRVDAGCVSFPDTPPNTSCAYNGTEWGRMDHSGHVVEMDTDAIPPYVTLKLHKSWSDAGDYLPYYIVVDTWPFGPARAMGVPNVPKHQHLGDVAVPLVQFVPGKRLHPSFPPMPFPGTTDGGEGGLAEGFGINGGGGPFGSQIGLPSYFMPEDDYSPMWHIGFAHWLQPHDRVIKGFKELKQARADGELEILEFPAPPSIGAGDNSADLDGDGIGDIRVDDYDFNNLNSPHVVNCPTPITLDTGIHKARNAGKGFVY